MSEEINPTDEELIIDEPLQQKIMEIVEERLEGISNQLKAAQEENKNLKQKHYKIEMQKKLKDNGLENSNWVDVLYDEDEKIVDFKIETVKRIIAEEVQRGVDKRIKDGSYTPPEGRIIRHSNNTFNNFVKNGGR
ncbi:hypothetical protein I5582_16700 [Clostridioides difficile]|nr:hypothetical protein [Clostridioides difficile]